MSVRIFDSPSCRGNQSGFTLIEILVVLLIITVLSGITVARLPSFFDSADMDEESRRIKLLFDMAHHEALLDSREFGFRLTAEGYEFLQYDDARQKWLTADQPLHPRKVKPPIKMSIRQTAEGITVPGGDLPTVLILSSGESSEFHLKLEAGRSSRTLVANGYGDFEWRDDE